MQVCVEIPVCLFYYGRKMERFGNFLRRIWHNLRRRSDFHGYVCDVCGGELFEYPEIRVCEKCAGLLTKNEKSLCPKCGRKGVSEGACLACKSHAPAFEIGYSYFVYETDTAALINRMKNGQPWLTRYFGECMADGFLEKGWVDFTTETPLVVSVPMGEKRLKERGYNQAERLAEAFCDRLKAKGAETEFRPRLLFKRLETLSQKDMDKTTRRKNAEDAYRVQEKKVCKGRTVLLIDDIMTTGATGSVCTEKILKAGASRVLFLTAASLAERKN